MIEIPYRLHAMHDSPNGCFQGHGAETLHLPVDDEELGGATVGSGSSEGDEFFVEWDAGLERRVVGYGCVGELLEGWVGGVGDSELDEEVGDDAVEVGVVVESL